MVSLGGLSGLGGVYPGYIKTMKDSAEARSADYNADMQVAGDQAFANSLQGFNANPPPGGTPMAPGQPSTPGGPSPMQGGPGGPGSPGPVSTGVVPGPGGGSPPPPGGGPPSPAPAGSFGPPEAGNGPPVGSFGGSPLPQGPGVPTAPAGSVAGAVGAPGQVVSPGDFQPGGQPARPMPQGQQPFQIPGQQQGQGGLDWRTVLQHVIQSNPGAPPGAIAYAVTKWLPVMSAASQEQWRTVQAQIREQGLTNQLAIAQSRADTATQIANLRSNTQEDIADKRNQNRIEVANINNQFKEKLEQIRQTGKVDLKNMDADLKKSLSQMNFEQRRELLGDKVAAQWDQLVYKEQAQDIRQEKRLAAQKDRLSMVLDARAEQYKYLTASREKIAGMNVMAREELAKMAEAGREHRAEMSNNLRSELARLGIDARQVLAEFNEAGRMTRFEQGLTAKTEAQERGIEAADARAAENRAFKAGESALTRENRLAVAQTQSASREELARLKNSWTQGRFDTAEARRGRQLALRENHDAAALTLSRERLEQQAKNQMSVENMRMFTTALKAEHDKNMETLQAFSMNNNMPDDIRNKLIAEERAFYDAKLREMRGLISGGGGKSPDRPPLNTGPGTNTGGWKITPIEPGAGAQGVP